MGRPPMYVTKVTVNLPDDVPARIDAIVGKQRRARFIRDAVEQALRVAETAIAHERHRNSLVRR